MKENSPKITIATILVTVIVLAVVAGMAVYGEQPLSVDAGNGEITIHGMYGVSVPLADVESVSLVEQSIEEAIPRAKRIKGYGGFGGTLKGTFHSRETGDFMLFANAGSVPLLRIVRKDAMDIYIGYPDGRQTEALYEKLNLLQCS